MGTYCCEALPAWIETMYGVSRSVAEIRSLKPLCPVDCGAWTDMKVGRCMVTISLNCVGLYMPEGSSGKPCICATRSLCLTCSFFSRRATQLDAYMWGAITKHTKTPAATSSAVPAPDYVSITTAKVLNKQAVKSSVTVETPLVQSTTKYGGF